MIYTLDRAQWIRGNVAETWFSLGGVVVPFPVDVIDYTDWEVVVDQAASFDIVRGSTVTVSAEDIDLQADFPAIALKKMPLKLCLPGVSVRILQIVVQRYTTVSWAGATGPDFLQPGMGIVGSLGPNPLISGGGKVLVRYRFARAVLANPMQFKPEIQMTAANLSAFAPVGVWERLWKLQLPPQTHYDRRLTGAIPVAPQLPMPNAYTFSICPQRPFSVALAWTLAGLQVDFATVYDPNVARDKTGAFLGLVANERRRPVVGVFPNGLFIAFRSTQRVYIRMSSTITGDLTVWSDIRIGSLLPQLGLTVGLPGYDTQPSAGTLGAALATAYQLEHHSQECLPTGFDNRRASARLEVKEEDEDEESSPSLVQVTPVCVPGPQRA
jgi:hypothetical protein